MSQEEIDKALGKIPQPEQIMLQLYTAEARVTFPEDLMLEPETFTSFVEHSIRHQNSLGFHVISVEVKHDLEFNFPVSYLHMKVAKLPKTNNKIIKK